MNNHVRTSEDQKPETLVPAGSKVTQPARVLPSTSKLIIGLSVAMILIAEIVTDFIGVIPGVGLYTLLLVAFAIYPYFSWSTAEPRVYHALMLLPVLRILSLVMPIPQGAPVLQYALIGVPLLFSALLTARFNRLTSLRIKLRWTELVVQFLFGLTGILFGFIAALVLPSPAEVLPGSALGANILLWVVLTIFVTVPEEIIFRGLVQKSLTPLFGFISVVFSSILYMSMFLGTMSVISILYFGLTGFIFGLWVQFSDSLWGAVMSHSMMNLVFIMLIALR